MRRLWRDHGLTIALVVLIAAVGTVYVIAGRVVVDGEAAAHGQPPPPVWPDFVATYLVNFAGILGDLCGVLALVLLTKRLTERDSDAGDDPEDELDSDRN